MVIYYIVLLIMTMFGSIASLFLKKASGLNSLIDMLKNINLYIGGFLYVSSAVLNIWLLKILDYSVILPLTSLTYIWTMILSYFILKEKITVKKIAGVCLILVGAIIISSL
ncbi:MAG: EamA family transporter [Solobacterium sp.]|nr:EamA family transporter [Solobacterium sp.]